MNQATNSIPTRRVGARAAAPAGAAPPIADKVLPFCTLSRDDTYEGAPPRLEIEGVQVLLVYLRDALALVRRRLWAHTTFPTSPMDTDLIKVPRALIDHWRDLLCYAA